MQSPPDYFSQPGYRGNLSTPQTLALLKLWRRFLRLCETAAPNASAKPDPQLRSSSKPHGQAAPEPFSASSSASASGDRLHSDPAASQYAEVDAGYAYASAGEAKESLPPQDDRLKDHLRSVEESRDLHAFLAAHGGAALKREFWAMVKGEHPDAVMLRFLRARRWNVDRALAVIGSACAFRVQHNVSQLMKDGELGLVRTRGGMNIFRNGISYIVGASPNGEPIYTIEVGSHYSSNQTAEELKNAVIYMQEVLSLMMPSPVEKKVVIFNLNNFGIRNMDWSIVLFMAKTMESFYPETLARVYVHGAPWIFKPIWSILRPLLDPVVRDKVHLTWKVEELAEHVPVDHLPNATLHGNLDFEFEFPVPEPGENDIQNEVERLDELRLAYLNVVTEFENATRALARSYAAASSSYDVSSQKSVGSRKGVKLAAAAKSRAIGGGGAGDSDSALDDDEPEGSASLRAMRDVLATKLRVAWLRLKPYVIGKTKYDRWGVSRPDGRIKWTYKTLAGRTETQILGERTSLPALEEALAEIEGVHHAQATPSSSGIAAATTASGRLPISKGNGSGTSSNVADATRQQPDVRSNLATAPVVVSRASDVSSATSRTSPRPLVAGGTEDGVKSSSTRAVARATGMATATAGEEGSDDAPRQSTDTSQFQDVIPIHPSDPAFERARNADSEVSKQR